MGSEVGFDFDSMGLKVIDVIDEGPDPHLFLITADLTLEEDKPLVRHSGGITIARLGN
jgi:hypothetical protein